MFRENLIEKVFKETYDQNEYKIIKTDSRIHSSTYIILNDGNVIIEFAVSDTNIFYAVSNGNLLSLQFEIRNWYTFIKSVEEGLKVHYEL